MSEILDVLAGLSPVLLYAVLGAGAAAENFFPPIPADTFVLVGGLLAALGRAEVWTVFWVTWGANVAAALVVYGAGHRYGRPFFQSGLGRHVLHRRQLRRLDRFYRRWGLPAVFLARFLPGFRAVIPAFAGVTHQPFLSVAAPVAAASGIWYGALVWLGFAAGRNLDVIVARLLGLNRALVAVAAVMAVGGVVWWYRTRRGRGP